MKRLYALAGNTLQIYGEINQFRADAFRADLLAHDGTSICVEIDSLGGSVLAGIDMHRELTASRKSVTTKVVGVACGAAAVVAMAGARRSMPSNTFLALAPVADEVLEEVVSVFKARTSMGEVALRKLLAKETWLGARDALANGFATEVVDHTKRQAAFAAHARVPAHVRAALSAGRPAARPLNVAAEIHALCDLAKRPQDAAGFIGAGTSLEQVRAALLPRLPQPNTQASTVDIWSARK
ncbi:ATP-dependent Clp protease proteolytic subunit [Variovorax sp. GT1P44]|uniref:ATP-dependent Clp protease proteolytic subunit n=1 Tax=Variovorax sp. GT1P44 TaxID=3443742 RepID=UPI003F45A476